MIKQEVLEELITKYSDINGSKEFILLCYTSFDFFVEHEFKRLIAGILNNRKDFEYSAKNLISYRDKLVERAEKSYSNKNFEGFLTFSRMIVLFRIIIDHYQSINSESN
jgi:hypothetical protein